MIEPNFNLMLWILLITFTIGAFSNIIAGCLQIEKSTKYTTANAIVGVIELALIAWIVVG